MEKCVFGKIRKWEDLEEEIKIGDMVTVTSSSIGIRREALVLGVTKYSSGAIDYNILFQFDPEDIYRRACVRDCEITKVEDGHWPKEALYPGDFFDALFEGRLHRYRVKDVLVYTGSTLLFPSASISNYVLILDKLEYMYYDENHICKIIKHKDIFKPAPLSVNETEALLLI